MSRFPIALFRTALKAGIEADEAAQLSESTEDYIVKKVEEANKEINGKLTVLLAAVGYLAIITTAAAAFGGYLAAGHH